MKLTRVTLFLNLIFGLLLAGSASAATFVVDSLSTEPEPTPGDGLCETPSGVCTLAAALQEAEAGIPSTFDVIDLTGVSGTITVNSVIFDEPVELRGAGITLDGPDESFIFRAENSVISGIKFVGFRAITLEANGQTFTGNTVRGGSGLRSFGTNTTITENRVFDQPTGIFAAIDIEGNDNGVVENNVIGFNESGTANPGGASAGLGVEKSSGITVTSNDSFGYIAGFFLSEVSDSTFQDNRIGDFGGATDNGADQHGIWSTSGTGNVFASNLTDGNTLSGIYFNLASNATVTGHTARNNGAAGVWIESNATVTVMNSNLEENETGITALGANSRFRGNQITQNTGIGIDLGNDGPTMNDDADAFTNFPVLSTATGGTPFAVDGDFSDAAAADSDVDIDFFASDSCDSSGNGEGATVMGSTTVTTDGSGFAVFSESFTAAVAEGKVVTATATGPAGTSEFSACITLAAADVLFADRFEVAAEVMGSE